MGRNSFRDPVTNVLKAHGFVATNSPGDLARKESDDFNLEPGLWRFDGVSWVHYPPPLTAEQQDINSARSMNDVAALKNMTPAQAATWVQNNVNSLSDAKALLKTMAAVICLLARRL